jgi:CBS domain-containing protein
MPTAREIMHEGAQCVGERETLQAAARMMRELDVGALPICGDDDRLKGMITDRDIVVRCLAEGGDPTMMRAGELAQGRPHWVSVDADIREVLAMMEEHQIRRLPVISDHRLVGMISEADLGRNLTDEQVGHMVSAVSATTTSGG